MNKHDILTMRVNWQLQRIEGLSEYPDRTFRDMSVKKLEAYYEYLKTVK